MNELVVILKADVLELFTKRELITPLLDRIECAATKERLDAKTEEGRKAIASMAYRVSQSKIYIEGYGKELATELKALPKLVDSNRKYAKDFLDALKSKVRGPLTAWEAEQEAIRMAVKVIESHEEALLYDTEWSNKKKLERQRLEKERADYEAKVLAEAKVKAKIEAEEKSRREIIEAEARVIVAEQQERRTKEQAKFDIERAKLEAIELEKNKQIEIEKQKETQAKLIELQKNEQQNVDRVNQSVVNDFISIGLSDLSARRILKSILEKKIRALRIEY